MNSSFMNSLIPARNTPVQQPTSSILPNVLIFLISFCLLVAAMFYFKDQISDTWKNALEAIQGYFGKTMVQVNDISDNNVPAASPPSSSPSGPSPSPDFSYMGPPEMSHSESIEKIMPGSTTNQVYNVSSNKYTYYDAEPLCKALGAELATYEQVKDAFSKGADWCNYGWVKGQLALYPTSEETYRKTEAGPEDQHGSCGNPGVNGGYFDNPEMRFGVNCYGKKPPKTLHNEVISANTPVSPDALAFDKKVNSFKAEANHIGILPFNNNSWA